MNTLRNKVQLIGNLGNDPEIIKLDSGKHLQHSLSQQMKVTKTPKAKKVTDTQ